MQWYTVLELHWPIMPMSQNLYDIVHVRSTGYSARTLDDSWRPGKDFPGQETRGPQGFVVPQSYDLLAGSFHTREAIDDVTASFWGIQLQHCRCDLMKETSELPTSNGNP